MSLAIIHARIRPADRARPSDTNAVLVRGDRIERVGPTKQVLAEVTPTTEVIDLGGRVLVPGFQDAHAHFLQMGMVARRPSLTDCRSIEDFRNVIDTAVRERPGHDLITFERWDENHWREPRVPRRTDLDSVSDRRPIVARRVCGHFTVANSPALEILVDRWNGSGIDVDSGHLVEEPSLNLDVMLLPEGDEARACFDAADTLALSLGITTSCDFLRPAMLRAWAHHLASEGARVRINAFVLEECLDHPEWMERARDRRFAIRGLKIFGDGTVGGRTAAMREDYADSPGERGDLLVTPEAMVRSVARAHGMGLSVAIHAIGDRAIDHTLDAFAALPSGETHGRGHRIEHAELVLPEHRARMRAMDVRPCVQPNFLQWALPGGLYERALGVERARRMNPIRTLMEDGCRPFFGSDGMPDSPAFGLRHAVNHPVETERILPEDALRLYTEAAADAVPGGFCRGRIAPGELADLAVFSDSPERLPFPGEADLTILGGRVVHRREALEDAPPA